MRHLAKVTLTVNLRLWSCLCCIFAFAVTVPAHAHDNVKRSFDIPASTADKALKLFVEQSGHGFLVNTETARAVRTNSIKGEFIPRDAMDLLLVNSSLSAVEDEKTGTFAVYQKAEGRIAQSQGVPQKIENDPLPAADAPQPSLPEAASPMSKAEVVVLPAFNVIGAPVDPYNASEATSSARTTGLLLDTPATAYVITSALLHDINPTSLFDVMGYLPGITAGRSSIANERMIFRGFENFGRTVDNFSETLIPLMYCQQSDFIPVFIERIELVLGPDAILNPTGTPGGTVSIVTKSPRFTPETDISAKVGNYNANIFTVDTTGPLGDGKHMAYRVIASYQSARTWLPGSMSYYAVGGGFTYKFKDTNKLTVKYFGTQQHIGGSLTAGGADGQIVSSPDTVGGVTISTTPEPGFLYRGWNGVGTCSKYVTRENRVIAELTEALTERINMRLAGYLYYTNWMTGIGFRPAPVLTETWDTVTGQQISVTPVDPTALPEVGVLFRLASRQIGAQNDYAGNFDMGHGCSLKPLIGWSYLQGQMMYYQAIDKNIPTCNLYTQNAFSPPMPDISAFTTSGLNQPGNGSILQLYTFLRASFLHDRLFVTGGAGRTWANVNIYSLPYIMQDGVNAGTPGPAVRKTFSNTTNPLMPTVKPWHDNYSAGILGKVLPNVSIYYNYSTSAPLASEAAMWQAGVQNEFGIKSNFFNNRLTISAAHFQITYNNIAYTNPLSLLGQSNIVTIYSNQTNHGVDFSVSGGITKDLSVVLSAERGHLRDAFGRRMRNIPDATATALVQYRFNLFNHSAQKNSTVFAGMVQQGNVAVENVGGFTSLGVPRQPGCYLPSFTIFNAGGGYRLGNWDFNLNVNNVFNERCWYQAQARSSVLPYPGTQVILSMTLHIH